MTSALKENPWLNIWVNPRKTIAGIIKYNPSVNLWLLSILHGLPMLLHVAQNMSLGAEFKTGWILFSAIILAGLVGIIGISIGALFCQWTGKWIGGKGTFVNVRAAVAWSNVPNIVTLIMWGLVIAAFGKDIFNGTFSSTAFTWKQMLLVGAGIIQLAMSIWSIVILVKGLAEAHGFSAWKGLLNAVLAVLFFIALFWALILVIFWATKGTPA